MAHGESQAPGPLPSPPVTTSRAMVPLSRDAVSPMRSMVVASVPAKRATPQLIDSFHEMAETSTMRFPRTRSGVLRRGSLAITAMSVWPPPLGAIELLFTVCGRVSQSEATGVLQQTIEG